MTQTSEKTSTLTEDAAAIHAVLADSYVAWARGDAAGMVADYTEDATAIMPGSLRGSRAVIQESMAGAFAGPFKDTWTTNDELSLRWLGRDGAIVVTESQVVSTRRSEAAALDRRADEPVFGKVYATWVLEKRDGRWLIAAYHNSPVVG